MKKYIRVIASFIILTIILAASLSSGSTFSGTSYSGTDEGTAKAADSKFADLLQGIKLDDNTLSYNSNDLVYHDYGENALDVDTDSTIIIQYLSNILDGQQVEGIYAFNLETESLYTISNSAYDIRYQIPQEGYYVIYALLQDGNIISLNEYVKVEQTISTNTSQKGFIELD